MTQPATKKVASKKDKQTASVVQATEDISQTNTPRNEIVLHLQTQVANAFVLYTNYKHYHWQTYGPLFRDLHLMFDEFAGEVLVTVDEIAERIRMIGQNPVANLSEIIATTSIKPTAGVHTMREMIQEGNDNLVLVIKEMRQGVKIADDQDDPGTADVFTRFVQIHEKHEWWLRDILEKRDGLTA